MTWKLKLVFHEKNNLEYKPERECLIFEVKGKLLPNLEDN